jgi:hypothetical protein
MKKWVPLLVASLVVIAVVFYPHDSRRAAALPEDLAELIDRAEKLVVLQEPFDGAEVLFESSERSDLDALKSSLRVERPQPNHYVHCKCDGTPAILFYANGQVIGQLTNHHAKFVRCSLWKSDAYLLDAEAFLKWFDERNILGPRREYERS